MTKSVNNKASSSFSCLCLCLCLRLSSCFCCCCAFLDLSWSLSPSECRMSSGRQRCTFPATMTLTPCPSPARQRAKSSEWSLVVLSASQYCTCTIQRIPPLVHQSEARRVVSCIATDTYRWKPFDVFISLSISIFCTPLLLATSVHRPVQHQNAPWSGDTPASR